MSMYAFNKLFGLGDIDCMVFDVDVVRDEGWFHNVFQDTWGESFEGEGDRFSVAYSVASLPG